MKKKGYLILLGAILIAVLIAVARFIIEEKMSEIFIKDNIEKYNFELSYPKTFIDNSKSGEEERILSNITSKVSGEVVNELLENINFSENVRDLLNRKNGIKLLIDCINIEKTSLSLEEICKRYSVMFKIYNEDAIIKEKNNEIKKINGKECGFVELIIEGESEDIIVNTYLISLDNREITITFIGTKSSMENYENKLNKIIDSIILY